MQFATLTVEEGAQHVALLTLNRPKAANAMNTQMGIDLRSFFSALYVDRQDIRCIVMTGSGERAFCAGGDLKERDDMSDQQWREQHAIFEQAMHAILHCPVPLIAAVNGAAYGGGCELALAADFAYAASNARFALTEVTLGIMPGAMGTQNLPHAVGERRAKEIILTGTPFDAEQAMQWGLANRVCESESLVSDALATATRIAGNAPIATRQAKRSIGIATQLDRSTGYMFEIEAYNRMVGSEDRLEGIKAFNEKRTPVFLDK